MTIDDLLSIGPLSWLLLVTMFTLFSAPIWVAPLIAWRQAHRIRKPLLYALVGSSTCVVVGYPLYGWLYELSQYDLILLRDRLEGDGASRLLVFLLDRSSVWAWLLLTLLLALFSFGCSALAYKFWPRRGAGTRAGS
ncbi:hypothetical protein [Inhella proteolytica]|uniref:Transmembrane protein n=1 Tax=Inhella proteolytica TaxID=2795029 RepID=A0A931J0G2_9BURK|nr:hypothetical protein [Inhella proteolytica]MBH9576086.1 hypothetical protein [Inhella proteolytica]